MLRRQAGSSSSARALSAALLCLALAAAGCGGADEQDQAQGKAPPAGQNFTAADLDRFIVKRSELPSGYERKRRSSGSPQEIVEAAETREERALVERVVAGLRTYSSVLYRKEAGDNSNSPGSSALLYKTPAAASKALPAVTKLATDSLVVTGDLEVEPPQKIPVSGLGDEAPAGAKMALGPFTMVTYVWRVRNIVVTLAGSDSVGDMNGKWLLEMAKKIDYRATR